MCPLFKSCDPSNQNAFDFGPHGWALTIQQGLPIPAALHSKWIIIRWQWSTLNAALFPLRLIVSPPPSHPATAVLCYSAAAGGANARTSFPHVSYVLATIPPQPHVYQAPSIKPHLSSPIYQAPCIQPHLSSPMHPAGNERAGARLAPSRKVLDPDPLLPQA